MGAGVQPAEAAAEQLHGEFALAQVVQVDIRNLEFAPGRRPDGRSHVHHLAVIKVEPGHGVARLGFSRLLLDADHPVVPVELDHAVALRVLDQVAEDDAAFLQLGAAPDDGGEIVAEEDVVAKHQADRLAGEEVPADEEGLGQPLGFGLLGVLQVQAEMRPVTEQFGEPGQVLGRGDDQDVADTRQHEHGQRVVDHRFVVHRDQLLADHPGERVEAGAGSARENDAFHWFSCKGRQGKLAS